jgi:hypothetical protein
MTWFMPSKYLAPVAACIWATTLAASPTAAQQPDSATIKGTFIMTPGSSGVGADLAEIVARGETHTWTLTLHGLSYSHESQPNNNGPYDYYARTITRVYATSFDFQFQGPDAEALNAIVSNGLMNGGLQDEPFVELRNVTYYDTDWGWLAEARDWVISVKPLNYQQGFKFFSVPASLEYPSYTADADGYPVLEPFTSGPWGAWVQITDLRPGNAGIIGTYGGNTVSVVSVNSPLPGDYNHDGAVDAADYIAWRKSPSDFGGNPGGYNTWRGHFGQSSGTGAMVNSVRNSAIPEPSSLALFSVAAPALLCRLSRSYLPLRKRKKVTRRLSHLRLAAHLIMRGDSDSALLSALSDF